MKNAFKAIAIAVILTFAITACGGGSAVPTPTSGPIVVNTPVPQEGNSAPALVTSELCTNQYWPIKDESRWAYNSTGSPAGEYEFGLLVRRVQADGFLAGATFKKKLGRQQWMCLPEGLVPLDIVTNNATSILAIRQFQDVKMTNLVGVYLPVTIVPGQAWSFEFDFTATQMEEGTPLPVTGHIKYEFSAGNNENVTVPAGSYDALPIVNKSTITFTVNGVENSVESNYTYWYAADVGWVKATGSGQLGGLEFFETLELVFYAHQ